MIHLTDAEHTLVKDTLVATFCQMILDGTIKEDDLERAIQASPYKEIPEQEILEETIALLEFTLTQREYERDIGGSVV